MLAVQFDSYGGPAVLQWAPAPEPHAGTGQVRIAVRAASVNPLDAKILGGLRSGGRPPDGPTYLGFDAAGVVDEVGAGVDDVQVGDAVLGRGRAAQAEHAVLDAWVAKPAQVDWPVAGAVGVVGETAERGLRLLRVSAGDTLFIDGGTGGVGTVTVQLAVARGARVIASGGVDGQDYLRELGALPVPHGPGVAQRAREVAGGLVDAVFDVAGRTPPTELVSLVADPSQVLSIANFSAPEVGARASGGGEDSHPVEALTEVAGLLAAGRLRVPVRTFGFDQVAQAYQVALDGHVRGKLVLLR